jgi:hypothetical protein
MAAPSRADVRRSACGGAADDEGGFEEDVARRDRPSSKRSAAAWTASARSFNSCAMPATLRPVRRLGEHPPHWATAVPIWPIDAPITPAGMWSKAF